MEDVRGMETVSGMPLVAQMTMLSYEAELAVQRRESRLLFIPCSVASFFDKLMFFLDERREVSCLLVPMAICNWLAPCVAVDLVCHLLETAGRLRSVSCG